MAFAKVVGVGEKKEAWKNLLFILLLVDCPQLALCSAVSENDFFLCKIYTGDIVRSMQCSCGHRTVQSRGVIQMLRCVICGIIML